MSLFVDNLFIYLITYSDLFIKYIDHYLQIKYHHLDIIAVSLMSMVGICLYEFITLDFFR